MGEKLFDYKPTMSLCIGYQAGGEYKVEHSLVPMNGMGP